MDFLLECLKEKSLEDLKTAQKALEAIIRWKRNPEKFLEPILVNGKIEYKVKR